MSVHQDSLQFDVVICGGGLAGLTLARQLNRLPEGERPGSIAVVDKQRSPLPEGAHKVGESTVEGGADYLRNVLGLREYLEEKHLFKNGLRFFLGNGRAPLHTRPEVGPGRFPITPAHQIDRGRLEQDLRAMNRADGIRILEGYVVREINLGVAAHPRELDTRHEVLIEGDDGALRLRCRRVVDALGRRRFLQSRLGLEVKRGEKRNAVWFRLPERVDPNGMVSHGETEWHARDPDRERILSTNHFMGRGYWAWLIPLAGGMTSVGITAADHRHAFEDYGNFEKARAWLGEHEPAIAQGMGDLENLDFLGLRDYSYGGTEFFSPSGWFRVGEAAVFTDPLYSMGTDFIAFANCLTTDIIAREARGENTSEVIIAYNSAFAEITDGFRDMFDGSYDVFGAPRVAALKFHWDIFFYWAFLAPLLVFHVYRLEGSSLPEFCAPYLRLNGRMQNLFRDWASRLEAGEDDGGPIKDFIHFSPDNTLFTILHRELNEARGPEAGREYMETHMRSLEETAQVIFFEALEDVLPDELKQFEQPVWTSTWLNSFALSLHPNRWEADGLFKPLSPRRVLMRVKMEMNTYLR